MIKIVCTNCQKPLSLDEAKLPMKEVSFPCPVCKTKLVVDRRNLSSAAAPASQPAAPVPAIDDDDDDEFGSKAFIVGNDNPGLRQAAKLIGHIPIVFGTADQARDRFLQDPPPVVFLSPTQMTPPPLEEMAAMTSLIPSERRKSFYVLVADNLRTLDGNAAFLYGVNLVVATKDIPNFQQIFRDAHAYHERLYASMKSVVRAIEGGVA
jgi:uncharacterized protein YbaR (Trm112 family)